MTTGSAVRARTGSDAVMLPKYSGGGEAVERSLLMFAWCHFITWMSAIYILLCEWLFHFLIHKGWLVTVPFGGRLFHIFMMFYEPHGGVMWRSKIRELWCNYNKVSYASHVSGRRRVPVSFCLLGEGLDKHKWCTIEKICGKDWSTFFMHIYVDFFYEDFLMWWICILLWRIQCL